MNRMKGLKKIINFKIKYMKIITKFSVIVAAIPLGVGLMGSIVVLAAGPATVNLGASGNFVILAKTGISTTGATAVVGDIGVSPAAATYLTGFALALPAGSAFSTSALVTGKVYAPGYADPTPANLTTAVLDMQTAYTDAAGRASTVTELGAGTIGGLTLAPGVYKWGTGVTIPTDVTLSGGAQDVWIFQIAQTLTVSSGAKVVLAGGAQASNIFWVVAGQTTLGTTAVFNGTILDQTAIVLNTGAKLNGRALAQTAVTLDSSTITLSTSATPAPTSTPVPTPTPTLSPTPIPTPTPTSTPSQVVCTQDAMQCPDGGYVSRQGSACTFAACPVAVSQAPTPPNSSASLDAAAALQVKLNGLVATLQALKAQQTAGQGSPTSVASSQQVRTIGIDLKMGSNGGSVNILQQFLISQGKGPAAQALARNGATVHFGALTRAALAEFQASVGITPSSGYFGAKTRAFINALN